MKPEQKRELDAWIAEHVMGLPPAFVVVKRGLYYRPGDKGYTNKMSEAGRYTLAEAKEREYPKSATKLSAWDEPVTYQPWECAHYTTDPAAAMFVLEKCAEKTSPLIQLRAEKSWKISSMMFGHGCNSSAETLPLAICLFARQLFEKHPCESVSICG